MTKENYSQDNLIKKLRETYSDLGGLVLHERFLGRVIDSTREKVAVLYKTPEGHLEQTYSHSQFFEGKLLLFYCIYHHKSLNRQLSGMKKYK